MFCCSMNKYYKWFSIVLIFLFVSVCATFFLPISPLLNAPFSQAVYDDNQHLLRLTLSSDQQYRLFVPLNQISPQLIEATLLQEDQYFRWHAGINPISLFKAA